MFSGNEIACRLTFGYLEGLVQKVHPPAAIRRSLSRRLTIRGAETLSMSSFQFRAGARHLPRKIAAALVLLLMAPLASAEDVAGDKAFAERVRPLLAKYCIDCHGAEMHEKDLRLDQLSVTFDGATVAK